MFNFLNVLDWKLLQTEITKFDVIINTTPIDTLLDNCFGILKYIGRDINFLILPVEYALPKDVYLVGSFQKDTEGKTLLKKWGFEFDMVYEEFRFDESFKPEKLDHFLLDFKFRKNLILLSLKISSKKEF